MSGKPLSMMLLVLMLLPGCGKQADHLADGAAERARFMREVEQKLVSIDAEMDSVKARLSTASASVKVKAEANLDSLNTARDRARLKLDELKSAGADGWEKAKATLADALGDLEKGIERARNALR